jgi:hypothetical protein
MIEMADAEGRPAARCYAHDRSGRLGCYVLETKAVAWGLLERHNGVIVTGGVAGSGVRVTRVPPSATSAAREESDVA